MKLLVQGWRFLPVSYAIVNQFQLLELLKRDDVHLRHQEAPYYQSHWQQIEGLLLSEYERRLREISPPEMGEQFDAVYRIQFPYNITPADSARRTFVFGTAEYGAVPKNWVTGGSLSELDVTIVTPSRWSKEGFVRSGADPEKVVVIPHGIDKQIFKPLPPEQKAMLRKQLGWEGFIFLSIGTMSANKGVNALLQAMAQVVAKHPEAKLHLKGLDRVYSSADALTQATQTLTQSDVARLDQHITYDGNIRPIAHIAKLYQAADAYISPYFGEGFNLPAWRRWPVDSP